MPADERPGNLDEQFEEPANDQIEAVAEQGAEENKQRSSATIAAAGVAGAAVVGTGAGAAVVGAARAAEYLSAEDDSAAETDSPGNGEASSRGGFSLDVFTDSAARSVDVDADDDEGAETSEDVEAVAPDTSRGGVTISQPLAPVADGMTDDNRKGQQRNEPPPASTPSAVSDATVIAANETGTASVAPTPILNRNNQPAAEEAAPAGSAAQSQAPSGAGFQSGPQGGQAVQSQPQTQAPASQAQPVAQEPATPGSPSSSSDIDVNEDVTPPENASSSASQSDSSSESSEAGASSSSSSETDEVMPTGPATVPASESVAATSTSESSSGSSDSSSDEPASMSDSSTGQYDDDGMQYPDNQYGEGHDAEPDYGQQPGYGQPPPAQQYDEVDDAPPVHQQPGYGHKPPVKDEQDNDGYQPPIHKPKPPVHAEDDYQVEPPHYDNDQQDDYVQDDYVEDDVVNDDYVEEPVYYDPYYAPFPGNKGYGHPQDLYGDPQPPAEGQAANVYVYRGAAGQDYATIIRDEDGNETITWWYGDPPNGHVVYEVRVEHDGYGNYTEQVTSYPIGEVDSVLGNIYVNDEQRVDPDIEYGPQYAEQVIDQHLITRTWTDEDGNIVIKKLHRDGSGKIEITYGDGVHVVFEGGQYAYYEDGVLIDGEEYVAPVEDDAVDGIHPLINGPDYFVDEAYVNPLTAGYEPIGNDDHLQFIDPDTGAKMFVTYLGNNTYSMGWQPDPNAPPGQYELIVTVTVGENGEYTGYETTYYTGDLLLVDTIPNLGYQSVEGTPYLDPIQEYGFPADNASQVMTDEKVVLTWETPEGPITKTYYLDGSHKTVIEYADGVEITYDPAVNEYPTYELPGEDVAGDAEINYYEADMFGDTYANPTVKYPDGPAGTFDENGIQTDYYPDGTRVQHYEDHVRITWYDAQGNVMLGVSVYGDGHQVDVLPWDYVLDTYGTVLDPIETSHGMYFDPASNGATYVQEVQYGMVKHTYPDGTEKVYLTAANDPGWIQINYPDGTVVVWNGDSIDSILEGSGEFATPLEDDTSDGPSFEIGGPEQFMVAEGVYFDNPEYDNDFTFSHASPDGLTLFFVDSTGYQAVIQDMNGSYTVFYGPNPPAQVDLVVSVQPDGTYNVQYYPAGDDAGEDDGSMPVQVPILEDLPFDFNELLPDPDLPEPGVPSQPSLDPVGSGVQASDLTMANPIAEQVMSFTSQPDLVYPRVVNWNDSGSSGWVVMEMEDGRLLEHRIGDASTYEWLPDAGSPVIVAQSGPQLLYVTGNGTAYFQTDSSQSSFFMVSQSGGQTPIGYADLPFVLPGEDPVFEVVEPEPESVSVVVQPSTIEETVHAAVSDAVDATGQALFDDVFMPIADANEAAWNAAEDLTGVDLIDMIPDDMPGKLPAPGVDSLYPDGVPPEEDDDGEGP